MGPETRIVRKILAALGEKYPKGYFRKIHGNQFQHAGIPDIIGCIDGRFMALEVKTTSGRVSTIQAIEGVSILEANGLYRVVTDEEETLDWLQKQLNSTTG